MQVMLMRLMSKGEYLIVSKGTKFKESGKLGLNRFIKVHKSVHFSEREFTRKEQIGNVKF